MAGTRIDWTEQELDKLYSAMKSIWEGPGGSSKSAMDLIRTAQITLDEHRRRQHLVALDNIPAPLRDRLIAAKIGLGWDKWLERQKPATPSKEEARINQLADERDAALAAVAPLEQEIKKLRAELFSFRNAPKPRSDSEIVQDFLAGVLYKARVWEKTIVKPVTEGESPRPTEAPPVQEPPVVKHNPFGQGRSEARKFKIAIVGGTATLHNELHKELGEIFEMRYFDPRDSNSGYGDRLKAFKDPLHGKVYYWTTYAQHQGKVTLEYQNIPYTPFHGEKKELIAKIKADARI